MPVDWPSVPSCGQSLRLSNPRKRFRDADQMLESFRKAKKKTLLRESARKKKTASRRKTTSRRKVA
jgi:hypothetical protein